MIPPCKDCPDRSVEPNRHTNCPHGYLEYKAERETIRKKRRDILILWKNQWSRPEREWFMKRKRRGL